MFDISVDLSGAILDQYHHCQVDNSFLLRSVNASFFSVYHAVNGDMTLQNSDLLQSSLI